MTFKITYVDGTVKRITADSFQYHDSSDCFIFMTAGRTSAYLPKRNVKVVEEDDD